MTSLRSLRWAFLASALLLLAAFPSTPTLAPTATASPAGCSAPVRLMCADVSVSFSGRICMSAWTPDCEFYISYFMSCSTTVAGGGRCTLVPSHSLAQTCTWGADQLGCAISHSDTFQSDVPNHRVVASGNGVHNLGFVDTDVDEACIDTPGSGFC